MDDQLQDASDRMCDAAIDAGAILAQRRPELLAIEKRIREATSADVCALLAFLIGRSRSSGVTTTDLTTYVTALAEEIP